jgi:[ribosomal protein S18]-alanine N-acetyltransferase
MTRRQSESPRLRGPSDSDIRRLVEIEQGSFAAPYYRDHRLTARDFAELMRREKTFFLVAQCERDIVGDLIGELPASPSRRLARLDSIAVDPKWQNRGVGRRLVMSLVSKARCAGYAGVTLEVAAPNLGAQRLFASLGFKKQRRMAGYYGERIDGIRMTLRF